MDLHYWLVYTSVSHYPVSCEIHAWHFCIWPLSIFGGLNCMVWRCCHSTLHERASYLIMVELFASGAFYSCNCSGIIISWQSRGRGRAQRGPRPLAWYELGCIRFQLLTRGAFRFHSRPGLPAHSLGFRSQSVDVLARGLVSETTPQVSLPMTWAAEVNLQVSLSVDWSPRPIRGFTCP